MQGKEIVLCNKDEFTTKEINEKFEKFFSDRKDEEKYETSSEEEIPFSECDSTVELQRKNIAPTKNHLTKL
jgi:hypothetical protein